MPIAGDVVIGHGVRIPQPDLVNLYGCTVGDDTRIGAFVEIQKNARIGHRCKISSHSFVCEGVTIEDDVFVGHGVMFINDRHPWATKADGTPQTERDWQVVPIRVRRGASIGSNATLLCGVTIGAGAIVGAGAVVTRDVPDGACVAGAPARQVKGEGGAAAAARVRTIRSRQMINVAVVGYGYWGPNLVTQLMEAADAQVKMVADLNPARLAQVQQRYPRIETTTRLRRRTRGPGD